MVDGSCDGLIRSYPQGVLDQREAGNGYVRVIIVGDEGTWGERMIGDILYSSCQANFINV